MLFDKRKLFKLYKVVLFAVIFFIISVSSISANAEESISFKGEGTKENPFLISNYEDLCLLRNQVNSGVEYKDIYFKQTEDIEMASEIWMPIGISESDSYFYGVYDGAGHAIKNLYIDGITTDTSNMGLFGRLGGTVANLKLENACVSGEESGVIAAYATSREGTAAIINCYVTGEILGNKIGGIAYDFSEGIIANCVSDVKLLFPIDTQEEHKGEYETQHRGGIVATASVGKVYSCFATTNQIMPEAHRSKTSEIIKEDELGTAAFRNKLNIRTGFTQALYGKQYNVSLMQWDVIENHEIGFSHNKLLLKLINGINEYLCTIILFLFAVWLIYKTRYQKSELIWREEKGFIIAVTIISGVIASFTNCAIVTRVNEVLTIGNSIFLILINLIFLNCFLLVWEHKTIDRTIIKNNISLIVVLLITFVLEILQFDITPRYDGALYYGSLVKGAELFNVDLFTYIGAFVCWKWIHGTALLIAPFEFLFPGEIIGVYIANVIITEITIVVFYNLIIELFKNVKNTTAAIFSFILILCPYQLGMFTYLCLDTHLVYYAIWLLYAYKKKNNLLISFCGFLMCFTKITGCVFYVVFLFTATLVEIIIEYRTKIMFGVTKWWKWSKCILWIFPAAIYAVTLKYGSIFVIQQFDANYFSKIASKSMVSLGNTIMQSYVFAFRWLFCLIIICAVIKILRESIGVSEILKTDAVPVVIATAISGFMLVALLLLYNSDAECPRYTALLNVSYSLLVTFSVFVLLKQDKNRRIIGIFLVVLLLIQTYWTIDPAIIFHKTAVDTGTNKLYRIALNNDDRPGMNIGWDFSYGYTSIGDIYAYNIEYNLYNDLLNGAMREIKPDENALFYVLDVVDYELHINGMQYPIYWNSRLEKMTYDGKDKDSVLLQEKSIATDELHYRVNNDEDFEKEFYLVVPARVDENNALNYLLEQQYKIEETYHQKNLYGAMKVYYISQ